jgi:hypothetical protein
MDVLDSLWLNLSGGIFKLYLKLFSQPNILDLQLIIIIYTVLWLCGALNPFQLLLHLLSVLNQLG